MAKKDQEELDEPTLEDLEEEDIVCCVFYRKNLKYRTCYSLYLYKLV